MNSLDKKIRDRINAFAEELAELVKVAAVESVQEAMGQTTPKRATAGRKKATRAGRPKKKAAARRKSGRRARRTPEEMEAMSSEILAHVKANQGQRLEQIAVDLGMDTAEMKRPVVLMLEAKQLSTKGQKRGTTYYPGKSKAAARKKATKKKVTRKKAKRRASATAA